MSQWQKLIATAPPVNPSDFSCSRSSSRDYSSFVSRDASWLVHSGYGTGARPILVGSAGAGLSR
jgi:hypothetical protein